MINEYTLNSSSKVKGVKMLEGVERRTLVHGRNILLGEFRLSKGSRVPLHKHPQEQCGYLVSGRMTFIIGSERRAMTAGSAWNIGSNVEHGVEVAEDSVVIETFSPVREDYID